MAFWKKLFGTKAEASQPSSRLDKHKKNSETMDLKTTSDLALLIKPLLRNATKISVLPASRPPENSQLQSHFGGTPYFESQESWPTTAHGKPLDFIFQVYNSLEFVLPQNIALLQFYYDWEKSPWDTQDDGWLVKIYKEIDLNKAQAKTKPDSLEKSRYCAIEFLPVSSLPDWDGIQIYNAEALKLSSVLDDNEPWAAYNNVAAKHTGDQEYKSLLGGYPKWIQGESTPKASDGSRMKLLFQLDSEENAGLLWGDCGLIYVFYDEKSEDIQFTLQCY